MLFSDRAEKSMTHDIPGLPKHFEAPDRVYGLSQTDNFKVLLDSTDKRSLAATPHRSLRETMKVNPFKPEVEPLLYPFLMMEAKSSKGADRLETNLQSAFVIRTLLNLQHDLKAATEEETKWRTGPLVWFLSWRGERWNVSGGFTSVSESQQVEYVREPLPGNTSHTCKILNFFRLSLIYGLAISAARMVPYSFF